MKLPLLTALLGKKKMELIWKNRDWPLSVSHRHSRPPTLRDDLPVSPFFLKTSYQLQILGLGNDTFVLLHITCSLHCEKTDSYLHLRRK